MKRLFNYFKNKIAFHFRAVPKSQNTMDFFNISVSTIVIRFFLMMAVIIAGVFTGQYWLVVLGLPIFLSGMLGIGFKTKEKDVKNAKQSNLQSRNKAA